MNAGNEKKKARKKRRKNEERRRKKKRKKKDKERMARRVTLEEMLKQDRRLVGCCSEAIEPFEFPAFHSFVERGDHHTVAKRLGSS